MFFFSRMEPPPKTNEVLPATGTRTQKEISSFQPSISRCENAVSFREFFMAEIHGWLWISTLCEEQPSALTACCHENKSICPEMMTYVFWGFPGFLSKAMVYSLPKMFSVSLSCFQLFADFTFSWSAFCHPGASVECWNAAGSHISSAAHRAASPCEFPGRQNFGSCVPWTISLHILNIKYQYHYLKQCQQKNLEKSLLH